MTRVFLDAILRDKLHNLSQPLDLCDEKGKFLAQVFPVLDPAEYDLEPQIDQDEIRRRKQSDEKTYSTAEVLAYLEKL